MFVYFDESREKWEALNKFTEDSLFHFFKFTSIWHGWDKQEDYMISFELPITLKEYIQKKFKSFYCETEIRWMTNVKRENGITLFSEADKKMKVIHKKEKKSK